MKIPALRLFVITLFIAISGACSAGEVLLHSCPSISIPVSSLSSPERTSKELVFLKQFFIGSEALEKLPHAIDITGSAPLGAVRALELATASDGIDKSRSFVVKRLEFLTSATPKPVDFYLIEMLANGSTEHRVVLMDGSIIKPRLKNVGK
jgi:hypothetical protein